MRITNKENPHIIQKALATFDTYWNSDNFEDYDYERFVAAISERNEVNRNVGRILQKFHVLPHQKAILDKLTVEREIRQHFWRTMGRRPQTINSWRSESFVYFDSVIQF